MKLASQRITVQNQRCGKVLIYCANTISVHCMVDIGDVVRKNFRPTGSINSFDGSA